MARTESLPSSSAVLQACWEAYVQRYQAQHGSRPSKQMVSTVYLLDDPALLSRWTNADHKPGWRIPVRRIAEAAYALELSAEQVNDLMLSRLHELEQQEQLSDAVVVADWCAEVLGDAEFLSDEERLVLGAFRRITDVFGEQLRPRFTDAEALARWFSDWFTEPDGPAEPDDPGERARQAAHVERVTRKLSALALRAPQAQDRRHTAKPLRGRAQVRDAMKALARKTRRRPAAPASEG